MTIKEVFIQSNAALKKVVDQISEDQWELDMPEGTSSRPAKLKEAVNHNTYDDAWVPDVLDGKTIEEVGDKYDFLKTNDEVIENYDKYNKIASETVNNFSDLEKVTHLSYGDFPAKTYLQHIVSFRAFRAYDIAKLIGVDSKLDDDLVDALLEEFTPVIESYRQMGVFPPAKEVAEDASKQAKLMAMVGRD
jgi:uncharacterized protein (TIGR03086 family)